MDTAANEQLRAAPQDGSYAMSLQWDERPYAVATFFHKAPSGARISVRIWSNAMLTVANLVDTGTCQPYISISGFFYLFFLFYIIRFCLVIVIGHPAQCSLVSRRHCPSKPPRRSVLGLS